MTHTAANRLDAPAFVPPEPYEKPDRSSIPLPLWARVAIWLALIAIEILALWLSLHK